jgi:hypothetical protein
MRAPGVRTVIEAVNSNHAKAALLSVGGRLFQSFKGANPGIIGFGLPVESGLSFFLVAESEPLLRSEILDHHFQPPPLVSGITSLTAGLSVSDSSQLHDTPDIGLLAVH